MTSQCFDAIVDFKVAENYATPTTRSILAMGVQLTGTNVHAARSAREVSFCDNSVFPLLRRLSRELPLSNYPDFIEFVQRRIWIVIGVFRRTNERRKGFCCRLTNVAVGNRRTKMQFPSLGDNITTGYVLASSADVWPEFHPWICDGKKLDRVDDIAPTTCRPTAIPADSRQEVGDAIVHAIFLASIYDRTAARNSTVVFLTT